MGELLPTVSLGANRTAVSVAAEGDRTCALLDSGAFRIPSGVCSRKTENVSTSMCSVTQHCPDHTSPFVIVSIVEDRFLFYTICTWDSCSLHFLHGDRAWCSCSVCGGRAGPCDPLRAS